MFTWYTSVNHPDLPTLSERLGRYLVEALIEAVADIVIEGVQEVINAKKAANDDEAIPLIESAEVQLEEWKSADAPFSHRSLKGLLPTLWTMTHGQAEPNFACISATTIAKEITTAIEQKSKEMAAIALHAPDPTDDGSRTVGKTPWTMARLRPFYLLAVNAHRAFDRNLRTAPALFEESLRNGLVNLEVQFLPRPPTTGSRSQKMAVSEWAHIGKQTQLTGRNPFAIRSGPAPGVSSASFAAMKRCEIEDPNASWEIKNVDPGEMWMYVNKCVVPTDLAEAMKWSNPPGEWQFIWTWFQGMKARPDSFFMWAIFLGWIFAKQLPKIRVGCPKAKENVLLFRGRVTEMGDLPWEATAAKNESELPWLATWVETVVMLAHPKSPVRTQSNQPGAPNPKRLDLEPLKKRGSEYL